MSQEIAEGNKSAVSLRSRFVQGIKWSVVSAVFTQGSIFASNIIVANLLGRDVFGEYGMVQSTLLTLSVIAQVATGITATKYVAEFRTVDKERTGKILGLCSLITLVTACIVTLFLFINAAWLATATLKSPQLTLGLKIASGFIFFTVINGYQVGALSGLESYSALARAGIAQGIFQLCLCSVTTWLWGLEGALAGLVVSAVIRWLIFNRALRLECEKQSIKISYVGIWHERTIFNRFAIPAAITGLSSMPSLWLANAFLVQQSAGYTQMGLYSAANNMRYVVLFMPVLFNNVGVSLLNNQKGVGNENRFRKVFWVNLAMTVIAVFVGATAIGLSGRWLLRMFGKDFVEGYAVLIVLMLSTLLEGIALALYQVIQCQEQMWFSFFCVALPRDGLIVLLAYILTPLYGALGLAWAYTIAWTLAFLIITSRVYFLGLNTRYQGKINGGVNEVI